MPGGSGPRPGRRFSARRPRVAGSSLDRGKRQVGPPVLGTGIRTHSVEKILARQPWNLLDPHILRAGADPSALAPRLKQFSNTLLEWNRGFSNLISRNDEGRFVQRHLLESLEPAHWIRSSGCSRWMDFGSGGGLPAVPLIMCGIGESWTLVESRRNKTLFLRKTIQDMGFSNVQVELARLELLLGESDRLGKFDGFTSRATLRLSPTLVLAASWVVPGGFAFLWKGSRREEEMAEDKRWQQSWELDGLLGIGSGQTVVARFVRKTE